MTQRPTSLINVRGYDLTTFNRLITEEQRQAIDTLWKAYKPRGREPKSYFRKLQRLESAGVDVSSVAPPLWGKQAPDWVIALAKGEGTETAHREWKREQICDSLSEADMAAGAKGAAEAKLDKSRAIIEAYKRASDLSISEIPRAIAVAKWWIEKQGLLATEKPNLVKRLKNTELVR